MGWELGVFFLLGKSSEAEGVVKSTRGRSHRVCELCGPKAAPSWAYEAPESIWNAP